MPESPQTQQVLVLDPAQAAIAREAAAAHGVEVRQVPARGIEPVTTVTLVLIGAVTAVGAVTHLLEQRKGGQVIDLRPGTPRALYRTPDVVYGTVVVIAADGTVTVEVKEPEGMFGKVVAALTELLSGGGDGGAEQIARDISATLGPDAAVSRSDAAVERSDAAVQRSDTAVERSEATVKRSEIDGGQGEPRAQGGVA